MSDPLEVTAFIDTPNLVLEGKMFGKVEYNLLDWVNQEDIEDLEVDIVIDGDPRYPTLLLNNDIGFSLNPRTGSLERCCICSAWEASECCCGAWDVTDDSDWDE